MKPGARKDTKDQKPGADGKNQNPEDENQNPNPGDEGDGDGHDEDETEEEEEDLDPKKAKDLIKSLRAENAKHRTKNKELVSKVSTMEDTFGKLKKAFGGEEEEIDPAEAAAGLTAQNERLQMEIHIRDIARDSGIPPEREKYFRFLLSERLESLEEGEELSDEDLQAVVQEATSGAANKKSSTGINANAGGGKKDPDSKSEISVAQFVKMNLGEKSELYSKKPELYNKLFAEAREKRMI